VTGKPPCGVGKGVVTVEIGVGVVEVVGEGTDELDDGGKLVDVGVDEDGAVGCVEPDGLVVAGAEVDELITVVVGAVVGADVVDAGVVVVVVAVAVDDVPPCGQGPSVSPWPRWPCRNPSSSVVSCFWAGVPGL
jgi:hypothetical protein